MRRFPARFERERGSGGCARQGEEREQGEGGGDSLWRPEACSDGRGGCELRREIAPASGLIGRGKKRAKREELRGFKGQGTEGSMEALNIRNHGEKITHGNGRRFPNVEDDDVMDDVIHFSFSFSFISVKSFI